MKYALGNLLFAGVLVLSFGAARADVLTLTSSSLKDNDQLAIKNACADKQRSPNCVGENISPPLAWSGAPEGTKSFAIVMLDPEGRAPAGVVHMVIYGIPGDVIAIHPYISGQPHRIKYLEAVYDYINRHAGIIHWNGKEILEWYLAARSS